MTTPKAKYKVGQKFKLSSDALENYGEQYADKMSTVRAVYDHYVSSTNMQNDP